ncbi:MAG: hypothetical protein US54_C0064G0001, partial [Candidatus Roizmanbacteria bacterium GW2011_GWA2_37_7]
MRMSPDSSPVPTSASGSTERLSLPKFFLRQEGEDEKGKVPEPQRELRKKEAYQEILKQKEINPKTRGIYADVLAREFIALQSLSDTAGFTPQAWQKRILDVVNPNSPVFKKIHGEGELSKKPSEQYATYRKIFVELLQKGESDNPDQAREWLTTAMEVTKRQIIAVEAITQAKIQSYANEAELDFADEIEISSSTLAHETGRPLDEVREEIVQLRKDQAGNPKWWQFIKRIKAGWHRNWVGDTTMYSKKGSISDMWNRFSHETEKELFSSIDVDFPHGHTVDYNRTVNGVGLDDVQQRDAYFAEFDTQLRTEYHLNLVVQDPANPQNYLHTYSGLDPVRPGIAGIAELTINVDNAAMPSLNQRLDLITMNIGRRTEQRVRDIERSEVTDAVDKRVQELQKRKSGRVLTPEETIAQKELEAKKAAGKTMETLSQQVARTEEEIKLQEQDLQEPIKKREEKKTKEAQKTTATKTKAKLVEEKTRKEGDLARLNSELSTMRGKLGTKGVNVADMNSAINKVEGQIETLEKGLYVDPGNISQSILHEEEEIVKKDEELVEIQKILDAHLSELTAYDALEETHEHNKQKLQNLQRRYPQGIDVRQVERKLSEFSGLSSAEEDELARLMTFKDEIVSETKWNQIQSRSYQDKITDPVVKQEIEIAMDARPHVQPAYLFMIHTIGGKDAIAETPEGHKKFAAISKLIPPELFFTIYKRNPARMANLQTAFNAAHGRMPVVAGLHIYDEDLQHPTVRNALLQEINKDFTTELLAELVHQARIKELGVEIKIDRDTLDDIEDAQITEDAAEKKQAELQQTVENTKNIYKFGTEIHSGITAENILTVVSGLGLTPDQAESAVDAVYESLRLSGIDRDVVDADFAAPSPLQPYLDGTFTDRGLTGLAIAIRRDLINHIRKSGISGAEIAPYARIEQAVVGVGLDRKKAPYVTAALKRAALKAGLNGEGITAEMLENPLGTATPEGVILDAELGGIHITLSRDQKAALLNSIPQEFVLQTFSREGDQLFDGTKPSGVRTDLGYDVLVID